MSRRAAVEVSRELVPYIFTPNGIPVCVSRGLPDGARFVGVELDRYNVDVFRFLFEHESFDEVAEGADAPPLEVVFCEVEYDGVHVHPRGAAAAAELEAAGYVVSSTPAPEVTS